MPQNKTELDNSAPLISPETRLPEITLKAVILAIILTVILGAANAYLALKVGNTVAASIPAAVIAMAIFRFFKKSNVLETNLVQTAASAGEGLASIITYVLPALVIIHYWLGFPYWKTMIIIILGGSLGVFFSIPLRRVLLGLKALPFPEGTAIGNVLKASAKRADIRNLLRGGLGGGIVVLAQTGFRILADHLPLWFRSDNTLFGISLGFNPALLGAGYIIGPISGVTMFAGTFAGWIIGLPILSRIYGTPPGVTGTEGMVMYIWSHHIRYIGVGTMVVAGAWTLLTLLKPITQGILVSFRNFKITDTMHPPILLRTERDMPIKVVLTGIALVLLLTFFFITYLTNTSSLMFSTHVALTTAVISVFYILIMGFISAVIAGYIVGLVGSTNTPLSGIVIINVVLFSLILFPFLGLHVDLKPQANQQAAIAILVLILTIIGAAAVITNENIQDLKAGQMVGATPWKQQVMMLIGVIVAAFSIPPVLNLLYQAYGMGGVFPHPGMDPSQMLPAPQAGLIAALAQGAVGHNLPWSMMITGGIIALVGIGIDEFLKTKGKRLPVLAVGLGIYLPPMITTPVLIGGLINYFSNRNLQKRLQTLSTAERKNIIAAKQESSILLACGLVAGASLMGVILAIPFVLKGNSNVLSLVSANFTPIAIILGSAVMVALCVWMYRAVCVIKNK